MTDRTDSTNILRFPSQFFWGTATAAHQVEGGNVNSDWWAWEQTGHVRDGSSSGVACDHYHLFREDFALFASLHQNAHRLSIEWARIEPRPGEFDPQEIRHYRTVIDELLRLGIEPVVTLHHFTNPAWLLQKGGWEVPEAIDAFARYVRRVVAELGDLVRFWITINEPVIYATEGYLAGEWPPGKRDPLLFRRVVRHMIMAHARATRIIHENSPRADAQVGIAHHLRIFDPYRRVMLPDHLVSWIGESFFNRRVLLSMLSGRFQFPFGHGPIPHSEGGVHGLDFIGLNYYSREMTTLDFRHPETCFGSFFAHPQHPKTSAGWEIYPEGIYRLLKYLARFKKPILITENGVADANDELRPAFLTAHLGQIHRAMQEGVPVTGYLHWSALDNFEWAEGRRLRFGLIHVDYETMRRTVKPSGDLYARICSEGAIDLRLVPA